MQKTVTLYQFGYKEAKTYLIAAAFIVGNVALPQLVHLIPQGGVTWLPIYLFTLVAAYKFGWKAGLLTAVFSPLINSLLFGMPATGVLWAVEMKSVLLAVIAGLTAARYGKLTPWLLLGVVFGYQFLGCMGEWAVTGSLYGAFQDFRIGIPGILLQLIAGYFLISRDYSKISKTTHTDTEE